MKEIIITFVIATVYNATPQQCNKDFLRTASMKKINIENPIEHRYIAVSRDIEGMGITLGDSVMVSNAGKMDGKYYVEDRMNKRWTKKIDFLVNNDVKLGKWFDVIITKL